MNIKINFLIILRSYELIYKNMKNKMIKKYILF